MDTDTDSPDTLGYIYTSDTRDFLARMSVSWNAERDTHVMMSTVDSVSSMRYCRQSICLVDCSLPSDAYLVINRQRA